MHEGIEIRDLTFRYPDSPHEVLHGLNLKIARGERVGIRGASGSGKTTLFNLMLGFLTPTQGEIRIDGTPLSQDNRRAWQNAVGYVAQQVFLSDGTFLDNVALGCRHESIDRTRAEEALHAAGLAPFIESLPQGMDTPVGECGNRLSGGQRQRVGIARALYKQAEILFFDEATSSLDPQAEERINQAIEHLIRCRSDLTIILIAHRESSLACCDRIITL